MKVLGFNHVYLVIIEDYSRLLKALVFGIVFIQAEQLWKILTISFDWLLSQSHKITGITGMSRVSQYAVRCLIAVRYL